MADPIPLTTLFPRETDQKKKKQPLVPIEDLFPGKEPQPAPVLPSAPPLPQPRPSYGYEDRLRAAKMGQPVGPGIPLETEDEIYAGLLDFASKQQEAANSRGEMWVPQSIEELDLLIEAKERKTPDWWQPETAWSAVKMTADDLTRGLIIGGTQEGIEQSGRILMDSATRGFLDNTSLNREARMILGSKDVSTETARKTTRLQMRQPHGVRPSSSGKLHGGTVQDQAKRYLENEFRLQNQILAQMNDERVQEIFDSLPGFLKGRGSEAVRIKKRLKEKVSAELVASMKRQNFEHFKSSLNASQVKGLNQEGINSITDLFDFPTGNATAKDIIKGLGRTVVGVAKGAGATGAEAFLRAGHDTHMLANLAAGFLVGDDLEMIDQRLKEKRYQRAHAYWAKKGKFLPKTLLAVEQNSAFSDQTAEEFLKEIFAGIPQEVQKEWDRELAPFVDEKKQALRERWFVKQQFMVDRERARLGLRPLVSQSADKFGRNELGNQLEGMVNSSVAEAGSYVADAPVAIGVATARTALGVGQSAATKGIGQKAVSSALTKAGESGEKIADTLMHPPSSLPIGIKEGVTEAAEVLGPNPKRLAEWLFERSNGFQIKNPTNNKIIESFNWWGGKIGAVQDLAGKPFQVVGAMGRNIRHGQTTKKFLQRVADDADSPEWIRGLAGAGTFLDGPAEKAYTLGIGTLSGGAAGFGMGITTGDPEIAWGAMGTAGTAGGAFGGVHLLTDDGHVRITNTVNEWRDRMRQRAGREKDPAKAQQILDAADILDKHPIETQIQVAELETLVRGVASNFGEGDVPIRYINDPNGSFAGKFDPDTGTIVLNPATFRGKGAWTVAHEVFHALEHIDNADMQAQVGELNSLLFGSPDGSGRHIGGAYSLNQQTGFANQYLKRFWEKYDAKSKQLKAAKEGTPEHAQLKKELETIAQETNRNLHSMGVAPGTRVLTPKEFVNNPEFQNYTFGEVRAEMFASWFTGQLPGKIEGAHPIVQRMVDRVVLTKGVESLGKLRWFLESGMGIKFEDGNPSPLFVEYKDGKIKGLTSSPQVNAMLRRFVMMKKGLREGAELLTKVDSLEFAIPYKEMGKNQSLMEMFKDDPALVRDEKGNPVFDTDGFPTLLTDTQVRQLQREQGKAIKDALRDIPDEGGVILQEAGDQSRYGGGAEGWTANRFNDAQLEALMGLPDNIMPQRMKDNLKVINEAIKRGETLTFLYKEVGTGRRKSGASRKTAAWRQDSIIGVEITKDGNINFRTLNLNRVETKANRWTSPNNRKTYLDLWGGDKPEAVHGFRSSLALYLDNHRNGRKGSEGLHPVPQVAEQMKERLNELFDVRGSRELRSYSASKPPSKNARGIESGRRLDGILKVLPGDGQWKLNYQKLRHNLMPAGADKGGAKFMPAGKSDSHALNIIKGIESPEGLPKNPTILNLAKYFQDRFEDPIDFKKASPEQNARFEDLVGKEVRHAMEIHPEAKGWYDENLGLAMSVLRELDPDIAKKENDFFFKAFLAVTSDGNKVDPQFKQAWNTYEHWKKTGEISGEFVSGDRVKNIRHNLKRINKVNTELGSPEKAAEWLTRKGTVKELRESAVKDLGFTAKQAESLGSGENIDAIIPFASIFGPKLGSFFNNLYGDYSTVTMDRWFMRTVGRNTGTQVKEPSKQVVRDAKNRLRLSVDALTAAERKQIGITKSSVAGGRYIDAAKKMAVYFTVKKNRDNASAKVDEVRKAANAIVKMQKPLVEAPEGGGHRKWIRDRIGAVQESLKADGIDLENADLQALLWYNEKELYESAGVRGPKGANDYASAAESLYASIRGRPSKSFAGGSGRVGGIGRGKGTSGLDGQSVAFMPAGDVLPALNVRNELSNKFADDIVDGRKTIETRRSRSMDPLIGKRVKIIRTTGKGSEAMVIGEVTIGKPVFYRTKAQFEKDFEKHLVPSDSGFGFSDGGKYGYPMIDAEKYDKPYKAPKNKGIVFTKNVGGPSADKQLRLERDLKKLKRN